MDDIELSRKREELKKAYPKAPKWADKVDRMSPAQVNAIYIRLSSEGKLGK